MKRTNRVTGCGDCPSRCPPIDPANDEAIELWGLVSTQWRASFGGLLGLDYSAVARVAEIHGFDLDDRLFGKLQTMERQVLLRQEEDQKREQMKNGGR